jgi:hypothetical protein
MNQWRYGPTRLPRSEDGGADGEEPTSRQPLTSPHAPRLGDELEQLVYRYHQRLIDELEAEKLEAMSPDKGARPSKRR